MFSGKSEGFTDPDFPPSPAILPKGSNAQWERACEIAGISDPSAIFHPEKTICSGNINCYPSDIAHPEDLSQVGLGDCYFLAAMSGLADVDHGLQIKKLFTEIDKVKQKEHRYTVELFDPRPEMLQKVAIEIDGWIPCDANRTPIFTRVPHGVFWPLLLEKAFAKMVGSYTVIGEGGLPSMSFDVLTGCKTDMFRRKLFPTWHAAEWCEVPTKYEVGKSNPLAAFSTVEDVEFLPSLPKPNVQHLWHRLKLAHNAPDALTAAGVLYGDGSTDERAALEAGFWNKHAYTILEVCEIDGVERIHEQTQYLKMRNPWGSFEKPYYYQKNEIVKSALAKSKSAAEKFNFTKPEDDEDGGIGWISFQDFVRVFWSVSINMRNKGF